VHHSHHIQPESRTSFELVIDGWCVLCIRSHVVVLMVLFMPSAGRADLGLTEFSNRWTQNVDDTTAGNGAD
jgi:hypothetical protein